MATPKKKESSKKLTFVVSDKKNPQVTLKAGMKFDVQSVQLIDENLKKLKAGAARLCGGTSTCLALIDIEDKVR